MIIHRDTIAVFEAFSNNNKSLMVKIAIFGDCLVQSMQQYPNEIQIVGNSLPYERIVNYSAIDQFIGDGYYPSLGTGDGRHS